MGTESPAATAATDTSIPEGFRAVEVWEGSVLDPETGEFLALEGEGDLAYDTEAGWIWRPKPAFAFVVDDLNKADWVLAKLATAEAELASVRLRRAALLENLERQERRHQQRINSLHARFGEQIRAVAEQELAKRGSKTKTIRLDHGSLSFRKTAGTTKLTDPEAALEWARSHARWIIKRKEYVTVTDARKAVEEARRDGSLVATPWIEVSGPHESFSIKTGVGKGGGQ